MSVSQITTHILDQVTGRPAAGVGAVLYSIAADGGTEVVAKGDTACGVVAGCGIGGVSGNSHV